MTNLLKKTLLLAGILYAQLGAAQTKADGMAAMQLEGWDKAISIYTAISKATPADQDAQLTLGNAYIAKGNNAKAAEVFQAAFDAKPDGAFGLVALARLSLLKNNIAETDKLLAKATKAPARRVFPIL